MKLVLFSDLHLDAPFAWLGATQGAARRRRQALRDALGRITALAQEIEADALLCAGDLYEHERVTEDTARFLQHTFANVAPMPVYLAPGNHDWFGPASIYRRIEWTPNVHVFAEDYPEPVVLDDGLTLWGAAHCAPANTDDFLEGFRVDRGGVHLGLFHGSLQGPMAALEEGKVPHAPFMLEEITAAGLHHAFVGHFHRPSSSAWHTYPGNPEPLTFGEDGVRGAVLATVHQSGAVERETRVVSQTPCHDLTLDVTGCSTSQDTRDRLRDLLLGQTGLARITVQGDLAPEIDLRPDDLASVPNDLDGLVIRLGAIRPAFDVDVIAAEPTVRGQFVRDVMAADLALDDRRRVLLAGLRALAGRDDLEVL